MTIPAGTRNARGRALLARVGPYREAWDAGTTASRTALAQQLGLSLSTLYRAAHSLGWVIHRHGANGRPASPEPPRPAA